jgi:hypothetical protein
LGFFGNQLLGDLFYSGLLFGAYALLGAGRWRLIAKAQAAAAARLS